MLIYDLRSYTLRPGKLQDFMRFYGEKALPIIRRVLEGRGRLVGHWITKSREVADLEGEIKTIEEAEVSYMLAFDSEEKHAEYWDRFAGEFRENIPEWMLLCSRMDNRVLETTEYHP